ncbi:sigma-70 family RNA polymerase sigma factor [Humisphaera borealis]|uniref:Sigma-70 family RNA polymerase sigma factor n=1 Tax=Humisphaera borealis TaxID=2807512 RepID=A0A7M2X2S8_9BACT|nr:sigma-70 family RNA polymerase sigma factor [Humisphaera borealis]QOV92077.1 sigma-70 family RNA polymerase sigma factor [Humisphaera borealis]
MGSTVGGPAVAGTGGANASIVQLLFLQHSAQVRGFIVALLPDLSQVDDVFQETFLTVTAKADVFDAQRDFLAWACGVARLKVREAGRKSPRQWRPLSDEVLEALAASEPPATGEDERLRHLADCVKALPEQSRRMIEYCYQQAHKPAEIARLMEWAVDSVYVALSRARSTLRDCVARKIAAEAGAT